MKQRCMCCFNEYEEGISKCPHCGYSESEYEENQYHLPLRTVLKGRYIIGKSLGQGGFGITYAAWDSLLEKKVAIKEYLPTDFATRSVGSPTVKVFNMESAQRFQKGMESFLGESRRLAKFATVPGVVGIFDCFNENSTAYIVMEYLEGKTLGQMVRQNGKLPYDKAVYIMLQVLNALDVVHQAGIIHRDIAPDNVFVCDDGRVKLLDFGAARFVTTSHSRSLSMILKMGYAPVEQYSSKGDQGTWTDVYACGATLYYAITGVQPVDSYDRMDETKDDKLAKPSKYAKKLPKNVETAILNAMNIMPENRTQTAKAFAEELEGTIDVKRVKEKLEHEDTGRIPAWMKANSVAAVIAAVAAVVLIAVGVSAVIVRSDKSNIPDGMTRVPNVVTQEADTAEETLNESTLKMVIGNRIFDSYYDKMSVIVQNPYAGGVAYQNSVVNVTLSGGTDNMVVMPDLSYYPQENAKELLESLGIFVQYEDGSDDIAAEGCVLKQSVKAGEYVKKGDSVILTVNKSDGLTDVSVSTEKVKVPDIVGMKMTEAANLLKESKLRISIVEAQYSDEHKAGTVLAQETKAQASVPAGTVINVTVSLGKQQYVVPDVLYMPEQDAKDRLTENSLQYKVLYEESDKVAAGVVLKQFPKFGKVVESQSVVTLTVSSGFKVTVPDVVGKKESDAKAALTGAGLGCKVVYEPSTTVKQGTVIRQSPKNGNKIEQGSVVEIVVSSGNNSISVTGVRLNNRSATLSINDRLTLYATVSPKNATNTVVSWSSSNSSVASVDGNGIVTANGVGSAVITVETADGGFTATCNVTVAKSVVSISVHNPKTKYYTNELFSKPTIIATFDDGSTENVTSSCSFEGFDLSVSGSHLIRVSYAYGGKTVNTSYFVSVGRPIKLSLNTSNVKKLYLTSEIINTSGIVITVEYDNQLSREVDADICSFSGFSSSSRCEDGRDIIVSFCEGNVTISASYKYKVFDYTSLNSSNSSWNLSIDGETYPKTHQFFLCYGGSSFGKDYVSDVQWKAETPPSPVYPTKQSDRITVDKNGIVTPIKPGVGFIRGYAMVNGAQFRSLDGTRPEGTITIYVWEKCSWEVIQSDLPDPCYQREPESDEIKKVFETKTQYCGKLFGSDVFCDWTDSNLYNSGDYYDIKTRVVQKVTFRPTWNK